MDKCHNDNKNTCGVCNNRNVRDENLVSIAHIVMPEVASLVAFSDLSQPPSTEKDGTPTVSYRMSQTAAGILKHLGYSRFSEVATRYGLANAQNRNSTDVLLDLESIAYDLGREYTHLLTCPLEEEDNSLSPQAANLLAIFSGRMVQIPSFSNLADAIIMVATRHSSSFRKAARMGLSPDYEPFLSFISSPVEDPICPPTAPNLAKDFLCRAGDLFGDVVETYKTDIRRLTFALSGGEDVREVLTNMLERYSSKDVDSFDGDDEPEY